MTFTLPDINKKHLLVASVKPRLFISYSRANLAHVGAIVQRLEAIYFDPWFDSRDIPGGEAWEYEIAKGIQNAQRLLFFMSPESCDSQYCQSEIAHAQKHGIHVIPIRINNRMPSEALDKVGLTGKQFIRWESEDEETNWRVLLNDKGMVKPPLQRDIRRLDPAYERLHQRYLKTFFRPEFSRVSLSDISEDAPVRGVPLTSVYVPLPVDMSMTIQVDEKDKKTIKDWWVTVEKSDTRADENIPEGIREQKLREWLSLGAGENELRLLLSDVEHKLAERAPTLKDAHFRSEQHWYMEAHDAANVQSRMVLTGIPGSGKSTFLKHLALCLAGDMLKDKADANIQALGFWTLPAYTPIFIRLADIVSESFPSETDKADTEDFDNFIQKKLADWQINDYWQDLQNQLYDGSAIILLDGLDEVPNAVEPWRRDQIIDFVENIINEYGNCRVIITSRPYAYNGTWQLGGFGQTTLIPLHDHRIYQLANALFSQLPKINDPKAEAQSFVDALKEQQQNAFWSNPLQFTMGATLWVRNADQPPEYRIPTTPALLYDKSVDLMLEKWTKRDASGAAVAELLGVSTAQLRSALERLALQMQSDYGSDNQATFRQWILIEHLEDCVQEQHKGQRKAIDYNLALDLLEKRAGILAAPDARVYRFQHLSYQEYLAACELVKPQHFPHMVPDKIIAQPGRWRNVIPLLIDIIKQRGDIALQTLARALLPTQDTAGLAVDHGLWEVIAHLATLYQSNENVLDTPQKQVLALHLSHLIEQGALAPIERAEMGRILSELGDPRAGTGTTQTIINGKTVDLPQITWCDIPAPSNGKFVMGADDQSNNPRREVMQKYSFKMSKYLITYRQFQTFVDSGEYDQPEWWLGFPPRYQPQKLAAQKNSYANHPRDNVSWYQAVAFTRWLTVKCQSAGLLTEGVEIRLPTEQEWEYAARGTDERTYSYQGDFDATKGNTSETNIKKTSAVGLFPHGKSPFDIHDMTGNLLEWCLNKYQTPDVIAVDDSSDSRVLRGGSFFYNQFYAAASFRLGNLPSYGLSNFGVRLVLSAPIASLSSVNLISDSL